GDRGEQGPAGSTLHLFDGNGQDLGILASLGFPGSYGGSTQYTTYIKLSSGENILVGTFTNGDSGSNGVAVLGQNSVATFFPQVDCEGEPLVYALEHFKTQEVLVRGNQYFMPRLDTAASRTVRSRIDGGTTTCHLI